MFQSPGRGITMSDGTIVIPSLFRDSLANKRMPYSTIIYSKDHGKSWVIGSGAKANTTECRVIELGDGSLMLNMRDNRGGSRSVYTTKDMGNTWQKHPSSRKALIEPVCNAGLIRIKAEDNVTGKDMLIFCNPNTRQGRSHMTLKLSFDEGLTWPQKYQLLIDDGSSAGYSSLTQIDRETIGVLYEGSHADICFRRIKITEIMSL
jgi:sialidase-1